MTHETRKVPKAALNFAIGEFELGDNGDGAKSAPFRMVARSGRPIEHWYWGNVVHDLDGMRLSKQRIPIDYCHDDREVIGYANRFSSDTGDLVVEGALVPYKDSDRATEIIYKQKEGVPYEASINFGGDGIKLEEVPEGRSVHVNGFNFSGPGVVIRQWPLRGVAVCPYGADQNTSTEFEAGQEVAVEIVEADDMAGEMLEQLEDNQPESEAVADVAAVEEAEPAVDDNAEAAAVPAAEAVEADDPEPTAANLSDSGRSEGLRFLEAFGDQGGVWFAQGKSYEEATKLFIDKLKTENAELRQRISAQSQFGEVEPVDFSRADVKPKTKVIRIAGGHR